MQPENERGIQVIQLEAPGDFLSELLGVVEAAVIPLDGVVRELPAARGWRLIAPLEGSLRAASGELSLPLEPGNAFAVGTEDEVSLLPAGPCRVGLLTLCGSAADQVLQACSSQGGLFFLRGGEAVSRMLRVLSSGHKRVSAREASELGYSLLMSLYGTGSAGPAGRHTMPPVVEAALGIIRRDYAFLEGIAELAERLEVSQEYLTRCFCKYTGITPGKYLNQVRIENARLLLRQGQHSIQFVSDACGFANANYFARVFRQSVGVNPREYARAGREEALLISEEDRLYVL